MGRGNSKRVMCAIKVLLSYKKKSLSVEIPAGVENGTRIRLSGEGEVGERGGPPGDLYVDVNIRSHQIFKREGSNLFCDVPISFTKAALGGTVEVPTIDGAVNLIIPKELVPPALLLSSIISEPALDPFVSVPSKMIFPVSSKSPSKIIPKF